MDYNSIHSGHTIKQTHYTRDYSDAWVLDGISYYFDRPYHGVSAAKAAVANGLNISATAYYGPGYGQYALLQGSKHVEFEIQGLFESIKHFFRGILDWYSVFTGKLTMLPGGCWWYHVDGPFEDLYCAGRTANQEVQARTKSSRVPCPAPGFVCYKFESPADPHYYGKKPLGGSSWSVSGYKRTAREESDLCTNFGITWTTGLDCVSDL